MSMIVDLTLGGILLTQALVTMDVAQVRAAERARAYNTGQYMNGIQAGLNKYVSVNGDALSGRSAGPITNPQRVPITLVNPLAPTIAELAQHGFLPQGYTANNPGKVTMTVSIQPTDCPGEACTLPATITTSPYRDLQNNVRNDLAAFVMKGSGLDGGQALASNPGQFTGLDGTWALPNTGGQAGAVVMRAGNLTTGYVDTLPFYKLDGSRRLTGTMQANNQSIQGANNVTANTVGLSAGNSLTIGGTQFYGDGGSAAIRTNGTVYLQGVNGVGQANLWAGAASFGGTMSAPNASVSGTMAATNVSANNASVGGTVTAGQVNASNSLVYGNQTTLGNQTVNGAITAGAVVYLAATAYDGWGCGGNAVTTQPDGEPLYCKGGVWTKMSGGQGTIVGTFSYTRPGQGITDVGFCYTWPGGDGRNNASGVVTCPSGTLGFVGGSINTSN